MVRVALTETLHEGDWVYDKDFPQWGPGTVVGLGLSEELRDTTFAWVKWWDGLDVTIDGTSYPISALRKV